MEDVLAHCEGKVALVGNGPLSKRDTEDVTEFKCVVRFNDMKNKKSGDQTTIHVSREVDGWFPGVTMDSSVPLLPVAVTEDIVRNNEKLRKRGNILDPLLVYETSRSENDLRREDAILFEGCDACEHMNCSHDFKRHGPSTGAIVIDSLEKMSSIDSVHIFGMNWNGTSHHVDFAQPNLVGTCCTKCVIHPTENNMYDGRDLLTKVIDNVKFRISRITK